MSGFFEYCVKCRRMFQSQEEWSEHRKMHQERSLAARSSKPFAEAEKRAVMENAANIPGADPGEIEDARIAKTKDLRAIKKALKKAGIECQTMNSKEAETAYEKAKSEGKVE
jgi:hypothetical protein